MKGVLRADPTGHGHSSPFQATYYNSITKYKKIGEIFCFICLNQLLIFVFNSATLSASIQIGILVKMDLNVQLLNNNCQHYSFDFKHEKYMKAAVMPHHFSQARFYIINLYSFLIMQGNFYQPRVLPFSPFLVVVNSKKPFGNNNIQILTCS